MALTSFCGLLTLQVGAAILAAVFFTIAGAISAANLFDYRFCPSEWFPYSLILLIVFVIGLIVAGTLMFASSYTENRSLAIMSVIIIVILICYWLILCAFSFVSNPNHVRGICMSTRCPETFWIGNLAYRRQHIKDKDEKKEEKLSDGRDNEEVEDENYEEEKADHEGGRRRRMEPSVKVLFENTSVIEDKGIKRKDKEYLNRTTKNNESMNLVVNPIMGKREQRQTKVYEEVKRDQEYIGIKEQKANFVRNEKRENRSENERLNYYELGYPFVMKKEERWQDGIILKSAEFEEETTKNKTDKKGDKKSKEDVDEDDKLSRIVFGSALIGAILLFIINFIFLLFSAFVMYSWAQELTWADYYYYDDDSVVVVDNY